MSNSEYIPFCLGILIVWSEDLITNLFEVYPLILGG